MLPNDYCELENLRKKLLKLGIGYPIKQIKGAKGEKGDPGPIIPSSTESIFFTTFQETNISDRMQFETPWLIPNPSKHFIIEDNQIELNPGLYEITLSGQIENVDNDHGANIYVQTSEGSEIKGLSFQLNKGNVNQMYFSRTILFRFENNTILEVWDYIIGDENTSNIIISEVNLYIKKIHE